MIVRNGKPVWTAGEDFLPSQLGPRNPRTAVGQRADGKIILLAVDGRRRGFSVGMTNWELAQAMVRLGAVTASALDAGGSTTMAFDGRLMNRPSDPGGERSVAESLAILYTGVYAPPPALPVVSPNGDGIAERQQLSFKVVAPSTVTTSLVGPGGATGVGRDHRAAARRLLVHVALAREEAPGRPARALALGRLRPGRPGPHLLGRALLLAERHARLHERRAALGAAAAEDAHRGRRPLQAGRARARDAFDLDDERAS